MSDRLSKSLLIIEDSDEDFAAFDRMMQRSSLQNPVFRCSDGDESLDFLYHRQNLLPQLPSIIILDLNLPGTDGREVLQEIKQDQHLKQIPVVVFTTSSNPQDIEVCYRYGVNGYIIKPMDTERLMKLIQIIIDYWFNAVIFPEPES
ncbi:MAG: response regulator [Chloroflexaceae bacterium]|nr:response regulator [Chloroflexaceae bacterium]